MGSPSPTAPAASPRAGSAKDTQISTNSSSLQPAKLKEDTPSLSPPHCWKEAGQVPFFMVLCLLFLFKVAWLVERV